MILFEPALMGF